MTAIDCPSFGQTGITFLLHFVARAEIPVVLRPRGEGGGAAEMKGTSVLNRSQDGCRYSIYQ